MAKGIYRTALGKTVNMDQLRLLHEQAKAVGNMNANARGDIVAADGTVVKGRNQRMQEHYQHRAPVDLTKIQKR